ncbi:MAG: heme A synthase [Actinomycetales bacterium]|nr:MAG: heme A synthase [Actinomycetales bacterium]
MRQVLPVTRPTWVRPILIANLIAEVLIVVTGGIVRLTGSGLGCPDWPTCAEGSLTPISGQSQGFHSVIEFGNRLLTGVLLVLAVLAVWAVWSAMPSRRTLHRVAWGIIGGVLAQAVVGGITVWTGLNPLVVAFHFLCSMVLIALSTGLLRGAEDGPEPQPRVALVPRLVTRLAWTTAALAGIVLALGTIVTGSGPHSGDADAPARTGFDPRTMSWLHADAVMLFAGLVVAMLIAVHLTTENTRARHTWSTVLGITVAQGVIGYAQFFAALPIMLVASHMLGATLLVVALTNGVANLYRHPV